MNIILSGGGTGGHLFPGIAIAQEFKRRGTDHNILFIGSKHGIEARVLPQKGFQLETTVIKGFQGKGIQKKIRSLISIPYALAQAMITVKKHKADIIIGMGGYISFPALIAGKAMRIPTAIHEQNSFPGLSNRIIGRCADRVFVSFEESSRHFQKDKTIYSGMPVRREFFSNLTVPDQNTFCVFVCGGSQGARQINRAVAEALPRLTGLKERIRFIHQTGPADCDDLKQCYREHGFEATVAPFFDDMLECYRQSHLVVARSGAATLAELALCARASILIPFPYAANNHQEKNARVFSERGAAHMILSEDIPSEPLAHCIIALEKNREKIAIMQKKAAALAQPQAAATIVDECCRLIAITGKRRSHVH